MTVLRLNHGFSSRFVGINHGFSSILTGCMLKLCLASLHRDMLSLTCHKSKWKPSQYDLMYLHWGIAPSLWKYRKCGYIWSMVFTPWLFSVVQYPGYISAEGYYTITAQCCAIHISYKNHPNLFTTYCAINYLDQVETCVYSTLERNGL